MKLLDTDDADCMKVQCCPRPCSTIVAAGVLERHGVVLERVGAFLTFSVQRHTFVHTFVFRAITITIGAMAQAGEVELLDADDADVAEGQGSKTDDQSMYTSLL